MGRQAELTELIRSLVTIETENPPGNEQACAEFIANWFDDRDVDARLVSKPYENRPQVVAQIGSGDPTLVFNGHIDVVPAGDRTEWSHDPYAADVEGDSLYGRGSVDMKTGVAVGMLTAVKLKEPLKSGELDGSIVVHAAIGEETAEPGTKTLLEEGPDGTHGVVLEPTSLRTATSEKGLAWYEITVEGDPSHASRPDQGTNAISRAQPVVEALEMYDERVRSRTDPLVGQAYATVTQFEAGTKENVVPEQAVITVDRRFLPSETVAEIDDEIESVLADVEDNHGIVPRWRRTRTYESASIPTDNPLAETFRENSAAVADISTEPWGIQASTDVRNFVNDADIDAITWGPGDISQAHTYDEHVDLGEASTGAEILERAARDILANGN